MDALQKATLLRSASDRAAQTSNKPQFASFSSEVSGRDEAFEASTNREECSPDTVQPSAQHPQTPDLGPQGRYVPGPERSQVRIKNGVNVSDKSNTSPSRAAATRTNTAA
jgi:hypothetical protein